MLSSGQQPTEALSRDGSGSSDPALNMDIPVGPEEPAPAAGTEVFVGGLPSDSTDDAVRAAFQAVGPVVSVRHVVQKLPSCLQVHACLSHRASKALVEYIPFDRLTRRKRGGDCKGFGFIKYADPSTADRACAEITEVQHP